MSTLDDEEKKAYERVIAITGIIGSGKTTVSSILKEKGAFVLDADLIAHQIFSPRDYAGFEGLKREITETFGEDIFKEDVLDRTALAKAAFATGETTQKLNAITHPHIQRVFLDIVKSVPEDQPVFYDIPLLFEAGLQEMVRKIVVVTAPEEIALKRAMWRLELTEEQARKRLSRQISIEKKEKLADFVVRNTGDLEHLRGEVDRLWEWVTGEKNEK